MFISNADLQSYTGVHDNPDLQTMVCGAAEDIICNYLGYKIINVDGSDNYIPYTHVFCGNGTNSLLLKAKPIQSIIYVTIDGGSIDPSTLITNEEFLYKTDSAFPDGKNNIVVSYTAGYKEDTLPSIIKLTGLRVAALLQDESSGNIGITSKSFGDSGQRSFVNYTSFDKYLISISRYKLLGV
jgi:hypothetical protein